MEADMATMIATMFDRWVIKLRDGIGSVPRASTAFMIFARVAFGHAATRGETARYRDCERRPGGPRRRRGTAARGSLPAGVNRCRSCLDLLGWTP